MTKSGKKTKPKLASAPILTETQLVAKKFRSKWRPKYMDVLFEERADRTRVVATDGVAMIIIDAAKKTKWPYSRQNKPKKKRRLLLDPSGAVMPESLERNFPNYENIGEGRYMPGIRVSVKRLMSLLRKMPQSGEVMLCVPHDPQTRPLRITSFLSGAIPHEVAAFLMNVR